MKFIRDLIEQKSGEAEMARRAGPGAAVSDRQEEQKPFAASDLYRVVEPAVDDAREDGLINVFDDAFDAPENDAPETPEDDVTGDSSLAEAPDDFLADAETGWGEDIREAEDLEPEDLEEEGLEEQDWVLSDLDEDEEGDASAPDADPEHADLRSIPDASAAEEMAPEQDEAIVAEDSAGESGVGEAADAAPEADFDILGAVRAARSKEAPAIVAASPAPADMQREARAPVVAQPEPGAAAGTVDIPQPASGRGKGRAGRAKTRLLGFNAGAESGADPFAKAENAPGEEGYSEFPVGWLVVTSGPGRGAAFTLHNGVSRIGRGADQTVRLDFGDNSISRENHAAIAYDAEQNAFFIGHGGKANLVRCNNMPVLATQMLSPGDSIRIGETSLRFVPLCGPEFHWAEGRTHAPSHAANG